jgi:hypothetical protein
MGVLLEVATPTDEVAAVLELGAPIVEDTLEEVLATAAAVLEETTPELDIPKVVDIMLEATLDWAVVWTVDAELL